MRKRCVLLLMPLLFTACDNNLTDPSPLIPSVAGNYAGTTSYSDSFVCRTTTSVTQNGSTVSIGPLQLSGPLEGQNGACPNTGIPLRETTINESGSLGPTGGTFSQGTCFFSYSATGGFVERDLRISLYAISVHSMSTNECNAELRLTINLTRQ
jgi:hypothetical protein